MDTQKFSRRDFIRGTMVGAAGIAAGSMLGGCTSGSTSASAKGSTVTASDGFSMAGFSQWSLDGGNAGCSGGGSFLDGEENRPSDAELEQMMQTANTYFQCHGLTGAHFIVIKDQAEQASIMQFMGCNGSGTVTLLCVADGLRNQAYHAEQYYPGSKQTNGGNPEYWNMHYGILELGWAEAYLNLAARELGYRIRSYGALNLPNGMTGEVAPYATGGNFEYIQEISWDIEKYMQPKNGGEKFKHYCMALDRDIVCDGNVNLVNTIVIGKIDEADTVSGATMNQPYKQGIRKNYDFWD